MEMYLAFGVIVIVLSLITESPITRYLTGYSWPATFLLILISAIVYSLLGPLIALPYLHDLQVAPSTENYLKLYITFVFIKTIIDTFFIQFVSTMFITGSSSASSPPFISTFKLLFIANLIVMAIVAWFHIRNLFPLLIEAIGISAA